MHECVICGAAKWDVVNRLHPTTRNPMPVCRSCYEEMVQQAENERQAERGEKHCPLCGGLAGSGVGGLHLLGCGVD